MKVGILTTQSPFIRGGAEMHADNLKAELIKRGHEAEIISLPFKGSPPQAVLDHMLSARAVDLSDCVPKIDLMICLKFPAWYVSHPNKVYWILHQHRDAYDLWDLGVSDLLHHDIGPMVREAITAADTYEFKDATRVFANSQNVADRLQRYNGLTAKPLYHPPPSWTDLRTGQVGDYIYYPSRIGPMKRQSLVIEALQYADPSVQVVFSGAPDNQSHLDTLLEQAKDYGVADRITWKGFITRAEMVDLYANCAGVVFPPVDEDLGYITLEAMLCEKPVVTTVDAGEPARIIRDGIEGFVTEPTAQAMGEALTKVMQRPGRLGKAARKRFDSMNISWDYVIQQLLGECQATPVKAVPQEEEKTEVAVYTPKHDMSQYWKGRQETSPRQALEEFAAPILKTTRRALVLTLKKPEVVPFGSWVALSDVDVERVPLPYPEQYFDTVLLDECLERWLHNPAHVLFQLRRVMKDEAKLVMLTPDHGVQGTAVYFDPTGVPPLAKYSKDTLAALLSGMGFKIQECIQAKLNDTRHGLFVHAQKQETLVPGALDDLYANDPGQMLAQLEQRPSKLPGCITVRARNTGWSPWTPQTICMGVYRWSSIGEITPHLSLLLPDEILPDEAFDFNLAIRAGASNTDSPRWTVELHKIDRGTLTCIPLGGTGLAPPLRLLANSIDFTHAA